MSIPNDPRSGQANGQATNGNGRPGGSGDALGGSASGGNGRTGSLLARSNDQADATSLPQVSAEVQAHLDELRERQNPFAPARVTIQGVGTITGSARIRPDGWIDLFDDGREARIGRLRERVEHLREQLQQALRHEAQLTAAGLCTVVPGRPCSSELRSDLGRAESELDALDQVLRYSYPPHLIKEVAWLFPAYDDPFREEGD